MMKVLLYRVFILVIGIVGLAVIIHGFHESDKGQILGGAFALLAFVFGIFSNKSISKSTLSQLDSSDVLEDSSDVLLDTLIHTVKTSIHIRERKNAIDKLCESYSNNAKTHNILKDIAKESIHIRERKYATKKLSDLIGK
ncbi:MAG: hypothetical protein FWG90_05405 [Oscillospiraceae bacterium]|nr:hypothetical protein [Oscillospiraceae bacterium]